MVNSAWPAGTGRMHAQVRGHDWAATPLGAVAAWPQSLRTAVEICLSSAFASYVWWGRDLTQVYNDPALAILRDKHPAAFAAPARQCWSDVWPAIGPLVDGVLGTGEAVLGEDMPMMPDRGGRREQAWFTFSYSAIRDEQGTIAGIFITAVETTARMQAEAGRMESEGQNKLLTAELQHRVRNTLAVVRSIARKTAELSDNSEDCAMHLDGRLGAFARVQSALLRNPSAGIDLAMLIAEELQAAGAAEGDQVRTISGPKLRLQAKAAETVARAIHELATNALKYGALASARGRVAVEWRVEREPEPYLVVTWTETGCPLPDGAPARRGFGTELIERSLPYDLGGRARLHFEPQGLRCEIMLPMVPHVVAP